MRCLFIVDSNPDIGRKNKNSLIMAEHTKNARPSTYDKHTSRSKKLNKQEKVKNGSYTSGGSPKGRHRKDK